jgi:hypothetical protein
MGSRATVEQRERETFAPTTDRIQFRSRSPFVPLHHNNKCGWSWHHSYGSLRDCFLLYPHCSIRSEKVHNYNPWELPCLPCPLPIIGWNSFAGLLHWSMCYPQPPVEILMMALSEKRTQTVSVVHLQVWIAHRIHFVFFVMVRYVLYGSNTINAASAFRNRGVITHGRTPSKNSLLSTYLCHNPSLTLLSSRSPLGTVTIVLLDGQIHHWQMTESWKHG